jgi:adenine-specific DNA-methyltransferase
MEKKKNTSKIQLLWEGKEQAILEHLTQPEQVYDIPSDIKGNEIHCVDNLDFLKLNRERLRGKVKCIYIDPPYNTGKDFIYKDKRHKGRECRHSKWLSFMYPRLMVAREMLREDGVIFVSIDDNEVHNLRQLMNEVFGEEEFVGQIQRKTRGSATTKSDAELQTLNDYILVYWKNKEISKFNLKNTGQKTYPFEDERGQFYIVQLQDNGPHGTRTARPNLYYPIYQNENGILSMERKNANDKEFLPKRHKNDDG